MTTSFEGSCASDYPIGLGVDEAIDLIVSHTQAHFLQSASVLRLPLRDAQTFVLAEDVQAPFDVPGHDNSAMDGFALRFSDLDQHQTSRLKLMDSVFAGDESSHKLDPGTCMKIMTGAKLPEGADTVVMKEQVVLDGDRALFEPGHHLSENVRYAGEDLKKGVVAIKAGTVLDSPQLGVIASLGFPEVKVYKKPVLALYSTGNELRSHGEPLKSGALYDSNRFSLCALARKAGIEVLDYGVVTDDKTSLAQVMNRASQSADMVISSGAVSMGDADFIPELISESGEILFWKMRMKPGHPLLFGKINQAYYFGLPGNPVSVMACFVHFVLPALQSLSGTEVKRPLRVKARLQDNLKSRPGRTEFQRGIMKPAESGEMEVFSTGSQSSGVLSSMACANCFIVLDENQGRISSGEQVWVEPFTGLV